MTKGMVELLAGHLLCRGRRADIVVRLDPFAIATGALDVDALLEIEHKQGVELYTLDNLHAKAYILDARWAAFGSTNFTAGGMGRNIEINCIVTSRESVAKLKNWTLNSIQKKRRIGVADLLRAKTDAKDMDIWKILNSWNKCAAFPTPGRFKKRTYFDQMLRCLKQFEGGISEERALEVLSWDRGKEKYAPKGRLNFLLTLGMVVATIDSGSIAYLPGQLSRGVNKKDLANQMLDKFPVFARVCDFVQSSEGKLNRSKLKEALATDFMGRDAEIDAARIWAVQLGCIKLAKGSSRKIMEVTSNSLKPTLKSAPTRANTRDARRSLPSD